MARRSGLGRGLGALIPTGRHGRRHRARACGRCRWVAIAPNPHQPRGLLRRGGAGEPDRVGRGARRAPADPGPGGRRRQVRADRGGAALASGQAGRAAVDPGRRARRRRGPARSSRPWSRTSTARTSTRSRRRRPTSSSSRTSSSPRRRWPRGSGKSRSAVANTLRLFQLPPVDPAAAWPRASWRPVTPRPCSARPTGPSRRRWPSRSWPSGLSVREVEEAVRRHNEADEAAPEATRRRPTPAATPARRRLRAPGLLELEELLAAHLDTRVSGRDGGRRRQGQGRRRVRRPRGPRADLPGDDGGRAARLSGAPQRDETLDERVEGLGVQR